MVSTICRWSSSDIEREKFFPPGLANKRGWTGGGCRNREQRDEKKGVHQAVWKNGRGRRRKKIKAQQRLQGLPREGDSCDAC